MTQEAPECQAKHADEGEVDAGADDGAGHVGLANGRVAGALAARDHEDFRTGDAFLF